MNDIQYTYTFMVEIASNKIIAVYRKKLFFGGNR